MRFGPGCSGADPSWAHLADLEAESITVLREAVACSRRPVMLYSIGKDSSVLLHLARKAFYPSTIPFPVLHIDTTWKFREMIVFRDRIADTCALDLIVHTNDQALADGITPESPDYTDRMKTAALRRALDAGGFDVAIGGARRDEDRSRAKERLFSVRALGHRWDPRRQRPELWDLPNTLLAPGETMRVFPLSNWTELDVWAYIRSERIEVVPLYFAKERPVIQRRGTLIVVDDDRLPLSPGERVRKVSVRFRTLGCYPLSGAIESQARTIDEIVAETARNRASERQGRLIDGDGPGAMERKKREGYF